MSRPSRETIITIETPDCQIDIVTANSLYTVLYKNQPFNIRKKYFIWKGKTMKSQYATYPTEAPAKNLANKLNNLFETTDFTIHKIW
jgi:hypothetical protein